MSNKVIIQGLDVFGFIRFVNKVLKQKQASLLSTIEELELVDHDKFMTLRKLILDTTNDFARQVVRELFGDIK